MRTLTLQSPAKINLMLAITGRRADGFHELVSVVAPLAWGDTLVVEEVAPAADAPGAGLSFSSDIGGTPTRTGSSDVGETPTARGTGVSPVGSQEREPRAPEPFTLSCAEPEVPVDRSNLILKAAEAFRVATGWKGGAHFALTKRVPIGAGLGGGSSNAATVLRALNECAGAPLGAAGLAELAARVGSDCALFLHDGPVVMRGRGETVTPLPAAAAEQLRGRSVLVFKPAFAISTAWAYGRLVATAPAGYIPAEQAEARLARWIEAARAGSDGAVDELRFNTMEPAAFAKFPALPLLLERLRRDFGLVAGMSGSGSACFAFLPAEAPVAEIRTAIRNAWGESAFVIQTRLQ